MSERASLVIRLNNTSTKERCPFCNLENRADSPFAVMTLGDWDENWPHQNSAFVCGACADRVAPELAALARVLNGDGDVRIRMQSEAALDSIAHITVSTRE